LTICAVSDSFTTSDRLDAEERQSSLKEMTELALTVAIGT
jgi:purine-nucleoside phosphorylase